jgi:threonine/homoserine/homoserine lactone efflux protein
VWLGVQAIRHRSDARLALETVGRGPRPPTPAWQSLRVGFTVGVTNPKTLVFFVAFLPQFVNDSAGHEGLQVAALGVVFGTLGVASDSIWALAAGKARDWFARRPHRLDRLSAAGGVMMIGLGATLAASK